MHQKTISEKELMEWFYKQNTDRKWRINAYVIQTGYTMAEAFRLLKAIEDRGTHIHLAQLPSGRRH